MRRLFWIALGAAAGILLVRRLTRTAQAWTPEGLAGSARAGAGGVAASVRGFFADVREAAAQRDAELRDALGIGGTAGNDVAGGETLG